MKTIGIFTKEGNHFHGEIRTLSLSILADFEPLAKKGEKSPDYRVTAEGSELGAAWKKTSQDGTEYLSVSLDDPTFASPIHCRLVKTGTEVTHTLTWERARKQD